MSPLIDVTAQALCEPGTVDKAAFLALERAEEGSMLHKMRSHVIRTLIGLPTQTVPLETRECVIERLECALLQACLGSFDELFIQGVAEKEKAEHGEGSFPGIGISEKKYEQADLEAYLGVVFDLCGKSSGDSTFLLLAERYLDKTGLPPYLASLYTYVLSRLPSEAMVFENKVKDFHAGAVGPFQLCLTARGQGSGFGGIYKKRGQILSFGPHFFPLGLPDQFGIFRSFDSFEDLVKQESPFRFAGWARAGLKGKGTDLWTFVDVLAQKESCHLKVKFNPCCDFSPFAFVFFLRAEGALIEGKKKLKPASLDRYQAGAAPVLFGDLEIKPLFDAEMQVIPLAGGKHFWGANFLLVFAITDETKTYTWEIR